MIRAASLAAKATTDAEKWLVRENVLLPDLMTLAAAGQILSSPRTAAMFLLATNAFLERLRQKFDEQTKKQADEIALMRANHRADVAVARAARAGLPDDAAWREIIEAVYDRSERVEAALQEQAVKMRELEVRHETEMTNLRAELTRRPTATGTGSKRAEFQYDGAGRIVGAQLVTD